MKLQQSLANGLLEQHPEDAARVLESLPEADALAFLGTVAPELAVETLRRLALHRSSALLSMLARDHAAAILGKLNSDLAANILRRIDVEARDALVGALGEEPARAVRTLLRFPEGTAGSLMNPGVLALPGDMTAEQTHAHMRATPENVRYNLYVVDREHVLVGVLNLRELLLAGKKDLLLSIAHRDVLSLPALADHQTILAHPAWDDARSIPVVDRNGIYLGAIRYRTMRRLEEELRAGERDDARSTVEALGDLFSTGLAGAVSAVAASAGRNAPTRNSHEDA